MREQAAAIAAAVFGIAVAPAAGAQAASAAEQPHLAEIRVGITAGDIRGDDHRALQAAVDYVAGLGGGTVYIGPGRYTMRNALRLRDHVRVVGVPGETVLVACDGVNVPLAVDGDCNQREITVTDGSAFRVGDGVSVSGQSGGFGVTTATLTARVDENTFTISAPLYLDYLVSRGAAARLTFPVVGGWQAKDAVIEGLTIDGNRERAEPLNGCRGGGIYLFECEDVTIRDCVVREYNGDGISFQVSQRVTIESCLSENNAGLGIHPGSGSQHPVVRGNRSVGNDSDGLYVCWRVKHGVFEQNEIRDNGRVGISIGHKDTDNLFRGNTITGNAGAGVLFRQELEAMGAHRNRFEQNVILDNGREAAGVAVLFQGPHHDVVFRDNTIGHSKQNGTATAIRTNPEVRGLDAKENRFLNVTTPIATEKQAEK